MVHLKINPWKFGDSFYLESHHDFRFQPLNFGGVDTKNDGYLIVSPFKYGYFMLFWVSMLVSGGGGKTSESEWNRKKQNFSKRDIQYIIETQRLIKNNLPTQH